MRARRLFYSLTFLSVEKETSAPPFFLFFKWRALKWFMLRQTDPIWQVQWHRGRKKYREWVKKGEWEKQTWRWLWWWCCPVLRGCSPVLWWPRVRGRRGHVVKTRWVHSWNTDGQQNFFFFFIKMQFEGHRGLQPVCTIIYTAKKIKKKNKTLTEREGQHDLCLEGAHF